MSNDNACSESQCKTTKYAGDYPQRFDSFDHAEAWCDTFFPRCNDAHRHSGIAYLTPATVHHSDPAAVLTQRQSAMDRADQRAPERFVNGPPRSPQLPIEVWLNRAEDQTAVIRTPHSTPRTTVSFLLTGSASRGDAVTLRTAPEGSPI